MMYMYMYVKNAATITAQYKNNTKVEATLYTYNYVNIPR